MIGRQASEQVVPSGRRLQRSTSVCATNPNDPCCQSCAEPNANANCPVPSSDASCAQGPLLPADDDLNLRCWEQKRRFGVDLLQPISRYVNGLTRQQVPDRSGAPVANPLFAGQQRHPSQVLYASIVGVPWQDIADAASLGTKLCELLADPQERSRRGEAGRLRIESERGALARTLELVESCLAYSASRSTASSAASASATR